MSDDIPENRFQLRQYVLQLLSRMAKWTTLARNGRAGYVGVTGPARNPALGDKDVEGMARRYQHFGFRSRAPKNSEVILLALRAGSANQVVIAEESFGHGPKVEDLKDGEVAVYDQAGSVLRMFEDGSVTVTAKAGSSLAMDKNGNVVVIPKAGLKVKLGSGTDAELDAVVLRSELKAQVNAIVTKYNGHFHGAMGGDPPVVAQQAAPLTDAIGSSNVVGKK